MTIRKTPRQRAGQRGADQAGRPASDFRDIARRRQETEEKLRKHLEGERDGRPVDDPHELVDPLEPGRHAHVMPPADPEGTPPDEPATERGPSARQDT